MNNKKIIGIPGWLLDGKYFGVNVDYINYISKFGIPLIITPEMVDNPPEVDMLYLPGGLDVNPLNYNGIPGYYTQNPNVMLEFFDNKILPKYLSRGTKIFAVCRSAQYLWGFFGNKIEQHNDWHKQSSYKTEQSHNLSFTDSFKKYNSLIAKVNSRHHQVMLNSEVIYGDLEVVAVAKEDKQVYDDIVEIWKSKNGQIFATQFHPENHDDTDELCPMIINEFLNN